MHNSMNLAPEAAGMLLQAAAAKGILKGRREALVERLESMASDLLPDGVTLFPLSLPAPEPVAASEAPGADFETLRQIGSRFLALRDNVKDDARRAGRFYTPTRVIDHIIRLLWSELFPDTRFHADSGPSVCDPAVGCAFFHLRLLELVVARYKPAPHQLRAWAAYCLYGVDSDPFAVFMARALFWVALSDGRGEYIPDSSRFVCGESLLGNGFGYGQESATTAAENSLDWELAFPEIAEEGGFDVIFGNPPYEVLTNFNKVPGRRELADAIRSSGLYNDALKGQINLYRCFIERSLSLLRSGGSLSFIVPLSLTRDAAAAGLRQRLLCECHAAEWRLFGEDAGVFPGVTQSVCIFKATADGGRAERLAIAIGDGQPAVMNLGEIEALDNACILPALDRDGMAMLRWFKDTCSGTLADAATFHVGEVDQTFFRECFRDKPTGCLLVRGAHVAPFACDVNPGPGKERFLDLERFLEMKGSKADECRKRASSPRIVQLGIRNMHIRPRLVAAIIPAGVYAGNSLNVYYPRQDLDSGYLAGMLNSRILDWLFRAGSANNNINLREMRSLPFPAFPSPELARAVVAAYGECELVAALGCVEEDDLAGVREKLDLAAAACYGIPKEMLAKLIDSM